MPSCACGKYFTIKVYPLKPQFSMDLCGECLANSIPQSYTNSHEWVQGCCQDDSGNKDNS